MSCLWCKDEESKDLIKALASPDAPQSDMKKVVSDLLHCLDCVNEYHRLKDKLNWTLAEKERLLFIEHERILHHFREVRKDIESLKNKKAVSMETISDFCRPLLEVLRYPYLFLKREITEHFSVVFEEMINYDKNILEVDYKCPGIYFLLINSSLKIKKWVVDLLGSLQTVGIEDFYIVKPIICSLINILLLDLLDEEAESDDISDEMSITEVSKLPCYFYQNISKYDLLLAYTVILNSMQSSVLKMLLTSARYKEFLPKLLKDFQENTDVFWQILSILQILFEKLGSTFWLLSNTFDDPALLFSMITKNPAFVNMTEKANLVAFADLAVDEDCKYSEIVFGHISDSSQDVSSKSAKIFSWILPFLTSVIGFEATLSDTIDIIFWFYIEIYGSHIQGSVLFYFAAQSFLAILSHLISMNRMNLVAKFIDEFVSILVTLLQMMESKAFFKITESASALVNVIVARSDGMKLLSDFSKSTFQYHFNKMKSKQSYDSAALSSILSFMLKSLTELKVEYHNETDVVEKIRETLNLGTQESPILLDSNENVVETETDYPDMSYMNKKSTKVVFTCILSGDEKFKNHVTNENEEFDGSQSPIQISDDDDDDEDCVIMSTDHVHLDTGLSISSPDECTAKDDVENRASNVVSSSTEVSCNKESEGKSKTRRRSETDGQSNKGIKLIAISDTVRSKRSVKRKSCDTRESGIGSSFISQINDVKQISSASVCKKGQSKKLISDRRKSVNSYDNMRSDGISKDIQCAKERLLQSKHKQKGKSWKDCSSLPTSGTLFKKTIMRNNSTEDSIPETFDSHSSIVYDINSNVNDFQKTTSKDPIKQLCSEKVSSVNLRRERIEKELSSPSRHSISIPDVQTTNDYTLACFHRMVLSWMPSWLEVGRNELELINELQSIPLMFTSYDKYAKTFWGLLLLEAWCVLKCGWNVNKHVSFCYQLNTTEEHTLVDNSYHIKCTIQDVLNGKNTYKCPCVDDIILLTFKKDGYINKVFGLVEHAERGLSGASGRYPSGVNMYTLTVKLNDIYTGVVFDTVNITLISSLAAIFRQWKAIISLQNSLLVKDILKPFCKKTYSLEIKTIESKGRLDKLNNKQLQAASAIIHAVNTHFEVPKIHIIHGAPGTGKSYTIKAVITYLLQSWSFADPKGLPVAKRPRILICAPSNSAIDEIMKRLILSPPWMNNSKKVQPDDKNCGDFNMLRIGQKCDVDEGLYRFTLDYLVSAHMNKEKWSYGNKMRREKLFASKEKYRKLLNALEVICMQLKSTPLRYNEYLERMEERSVLQKKYDEIIKQCSNTINLHEEQLECERRLLLKADIICCTLFESGSNCMIRTFKDNVHVPFKCVFIDEASQCSEAEALIPMQYSISKVFLISDSLRAPAHVFSKKAARYNFTQSLYQRLHLALTENTYVFKHNVMLSVQYRMCPELFSFPSSRFYLNTTKSIKDDSSQKQLYPLKSFVLLDLKASEDEERDSRNHDFCEQRNIVSICRSILDAKINRASIGVLCTDDQQVKYLKDLFKNNKISPIFVDTVDGFRGKERDIVILSCARESNTAICKDFLVDQHAMNIALTRAKHSLIIIGNTDSIEVSEDWKALVNDAKARGMFYDVTTVDETLDSMFSTQWKESFIKEMGNHPTSFVCDYTQSVASVAEDCTFEMGGDQSCGLNTAKERRLLREDKLLRNVGCGVSNKCKAMYGIEIDFKSMMQPDVEEIPKQIKKAIQSDPPTDYPTIETKMKATSDSKNEMNMLERKPQMADDAETDFQTDMFNGDNSKETCLIATGITAAVLEQSKKFDNEKCRMRCVSPKQITSNIQKEAKVVTIGRPRKTSDSVKEVISSYLNQTDELGHDDSGETHVNREGYNSDVQNVTEVLNENSKKRDVFLKRPRFRNDSEDVTCDKLIGEDKKHSESLDDGKSRKICVPAERHISNVEKHQNEAIHMLMEQTTPNEKHLDISENIESRNCMAVLEGDVEVCMEIDRKQLDDNPSQKQGESLSKHCNGEILFVASSCPNVVDSIGDKLEGVNGIRTRRELSVNGNKYSCGDMMCPGTRSVGDEVRTSVTQKVLSSTLDNVPIPMDKCGNRIAKNGGKLDAPISRHSPISRLHHLANRTFDDDSEDENQLSNLPCASTIKHSADDKKRRTSKNREKRKRQRNKRKKISDSKSGNGVNDLEVPVSNSNLSNKNDSVSDHNKNCGSVTVPHFPQPLNRKGNGKIYKKTKLRSNNKCVERNNVEEEQGRFCGKSASMELVTHSNESFESIRISIELLRKEKLTTNNPDKLQALEEAIEKLLPLRNMHSHDRHASTNANANTGSDSEFNIQPVHSYNEATSQTFIASNINSHFSANMGHQLSPIATDSCEERVILKDVNETSPNFVSHNVPMQNTMESPNSYTQDDTGFHPLSRSPQEKCISVCKYTRKGPSMSYFLFPHRHSDGTFCAKVCQRYIKRERLKNGEGSCPQQKQQAAVNLPWQLVPLDVPEIQKRDFVRSSDPRLTLHPGWSHKGMALYSSNKEIGSENIYSGGCHTTSIAPCFSEHSPNRSDKQSVASQQVSCLPKSFAYVGRLQIPCTSLPSCTVNTVSFSSNSTSQYDVYVHQDRFPTKCSQFLNSTSSSMSLYQHGSRLNTSVSVAYSNDLIANLPATSLSPKISIVHPLPTISTCKSETLTTLPHVSSVQTISLSKCAPASLQPSPSTATNSSPCRSQYLSQSIKVEPTSCGLNTSSHRIKKPTQCHASIPSIDQRVVCCATFNVGGDQSLPVCSSNNNEFIGRTSMKNERPHLFTTTTSGLPMASVSTVSQPIGVASLNKRDQGLTAIDIDENLLLRPPTPTLDERPSCSLILRRNSSVENITPKSTRYKDYCLESPCNIRISLNETRSNNCTSVTANYVSNSHYRSPANQPIHCAPPIPTCCPSVCSKSSERSSFQDLQSFEGCSKSRCFDTSSNNNDISFSHHGKPIYSPSPPSTPIRQIQSNNGQVGNDLGETPPKYLMTQQGNQFVPKEAAVTPDITSPVHDSSDHSQSIPFPIRQALSASLDYIGNELTPIQKDYALNYAAGYLAYLLKTLFGGDIKDVHSKYVYAFIYFAALNAYYPNLRHQSAHLDKSETENVTLIDSFSSIVSQDVNDMFNQVHSITDIKMEELVSDPYQHYIKSFAGNFNPTRDIDKFVSHFTNNYRKSHLLDSKSENNSESSRLKISKKHVSFSNYAGRSNSVDDSHMVNDTPIINSPTCNDKKTSMLIKTDELRKKLCDRRNSNSFSNEEHNHFHKQYNRCKSEESSLPKQSIGMFPSLTHSRAPKLKNQNIFSASLAKGRSISVNSFSKNTDSAELKSAHLPKQRKSVTSSLKTRLSMETLNRNTANSNFKEDDCIETAKPAIAATYRHDSNKEFVDGEKKKNQLLHQPPDIRVAEDINLQTKLYENVDIEAERKMGCLSTAQHERKKRQNDDVNFMGRSKRKYLSKRKSRFTYVAPGYVPSPSRFHWSSTNSPSEGAKKVDSS